MAASRKRVVEVGFERARDSKRAMHAASGAQRVLLRQRTIEAYETIVAGAGTADPAAVEAAFRIGELYRAAGDIERASEAFERAALAVTVAFGCRARLELGNLARRNGDLEWAVRQYQKLLLGPCDDPYVRDAALFWLARVHAEGGSVHAAVDTLTQLRARLDSGALLERVDRELERLSGDDGP